MATIGEKLMYSDNKRVKVDEIKQIINDFHKAHADRNIEVIFYHELKEDTYKPKHELDFSRFVCAHINPLNIRKNSNTLSFYDTKGNKGKFYLKRLAYVRLDKDKYRVFN